MGRKAGIVSILIFLNSVVLAQEVRPDGYFLKDSIKLGEEVEYSLSIRYPREMEALFPDSSHTYLPFEFQKRKYFTTRVDSVYAYDSAVYTLMSFEIEPIQYLQIPIYMLDGKDSSEVYPPLDSVYFQEMVLEMPDSLDLKAHASYQAVSHAFNYPYYLIGLFVFVIALGVVYLIFGKTISRKIKLYKLKKDYERFSSRFENGINNLKKNGESVFVEEALVIWKSYMERLEDRPFTKYTTKEILRSGYDESLKQTLMDIDRSIYGHFETDGIHRNFESLEDFTLERYRLKLKEITNG